MKKSAPKQTDKIRADKIRADKIKPDDAALFRAAIGAVQPLAEQNRIIPQPVPRKSFRPADLPSALPDTLYDSTHASAPGEYLSNGLSRMTLRKLRRGNWPIQDTLDLHGLHSDAARKQVQAFLYAAVQRELRCVLLIHGKGINSQGGAAVLRNLARHWLIQHPDVLGYCEASAKEGGSGAVLILLKMNRSALANN